MIAAASQNRVQSRGQASKQQRRRRQCTSGKRVWYEGTVCMIQWYQEKQAQAPLLGKALL